MVKRGLGESGDGDVVSVEEVRGVIWGKVKDWKVGGVKGGVD